MKRKLYLTVALLLALTVSSGAYAYTYATSSGRIAIADPTGDIANITRAAPGAQPDWEDILPEGLTYSEYLIPYSAGDVTNIPNQEPDSGEHWDKVDDIPADDMATFVANPNPVQYRSDLYQFTDYVEAWGFETINSVTVHFRVSGSPGALSRAIIKTNGANFVGDNEVHTGGQWLDYSYQWTTNPATDEAWTWSEINQLQAGISLQGVQQGAPTVCTQVYIVVDYEYVVVEGDVPEGDLYTVSPHPEYTGDLSVRVYLVNSGALIKAFQYLNIKISLDGAEEDFQILSLSNGMVSFTMEGCTGGTLPLSVTGGSYRFVSDDPDDWGTGWNANPEFYCEVTQR